MHLTRGFLLLSLTGIFGFASAEAQELSDEDQILQLEQEWARALARHDSIALARIIAHGFTFIEADGSVLEREEYLSRRANSTAEIDLFEVSDMTVRILGSTALVSGLARIIQRRGDQWYRFELRWKELWIKRIGTWQVLAGQATPVNPQWYEAFATSRP